MARGIARTAAVADLFEYIEVFYNRIVVIHRSASYRQPSSCKTVGGSAMDAAA
jgi:hypothetical protein